MALSRVRRCVPLLALLAVLGAPPAQAVLFKYVDPVTRVASYTNFRPPQPGARELVLRVLRPQAPPRSAPARAAAPSPMLGPANFPRIDAPAQRALDADRKRIIGDELQAAQAELARLLAGRAAPSHIGRHRGDVAALQRELARLP